MTKPTSLFAALLALAIVPVHAQETEDTAPAVERAEEALEAAADDEVLETPGDENLEVTAVPEQRPTNAPLRFTYEEFMEADQDGNGILSIEEANAALPEIGFEDANGDGLLNLAEVDAAVEGLDMVIEGAATWSVVGESSFIRILRTLEERAQNGGALENAENAQNEHDARSEEARQQS